VEKRGGLGYFAKSTAPSPTLDLKNGSLFFLSALLIYIFVFFLAIFSIYIREDGFQSRPVTE
jgi:hypothetical protein